MLPTTQANAWSVLALSAYLRKIETGDRNASGEVRWNKLVTPFSVSDPKPIATAITTATGAAIQMVRFDTRPASLTCGAIPCDGSVCFAPPDLFPDPLFDVDLLLRVMVLVTSARVLA